MKKSELRQTIREEIQKLKEIKKLNEELIGTYKGSDILNKEEVEIFKNPKTIKRMEDYSRAISDNRGNLYIIDSSEWIHERLMQWLNNVMKINLGSNPYNVDKVVAWQKEKDGSLYLSPGYPGLKDKIEKIEEMIEKAQKKNPNIDFQLGISTEYSKHS